MHSWPYNLYVPAEESKAGKSNSETSVTPNHRGQVVDNSTN